MTRPLALILAAAMLAACTVTGCTLSRQPQTLAERTADTHQRLDAAPTPDARRAAALGLFARTGLSPVAGLRPGTGARYAAGRLVVGFVPGRRAGLRDTLVVVAAALDGPHAATLVEAARLLTERADTRGDAPERSVLVALWDVGLSAEDGLAAVRAFPLWPRDAVRLTIVLDDRLATRDELVPPVVVFRDLPPDADAASLAEAVLAAAAPLAD